MVPFHRHCVPYPASKYSLIVPMWCARVVVTLITIPMASLPCVPSRKDGRPQGRHFITFYRVLMNTWSLFVPIRLIREHLYIYHFLYKKYTFLSFFETCIYIWILIASHWCRAIVGVHLVVHTEGYGSDVGRVNIYIYRMRARVSIWTPPAWTAFPFLPWLWRHYHSYRGLNNIEWFRCDDLDMLDPNDEPGKDCPPQK